MGISFEYGYVFAYFYIDTLTFYCYSESMCLYVIKKRVFIKMYKRKWIINGTADEIDGKGLVFFVVGVICPYGDSYCAMRMRARLGSPHLGCTTN